MLVVLPTVTNPQVTVGWLEIDKHLSLELCFFSIEKQPETVSPVTSIGSYRDHQLLSQRSTKTQVTKTHEVPNLKYTFIIETV